MNVFENSRMTHSVSDLRIENRNNHSFESLRAGSESVQRDDAVWVQRSQ